MDNSELGCTNLQISPIGYGAFKIGRNVGTKYAQNYELPDIKSVETILNRVIDLGVTYIDTAPAYGLSEERIGNVLGDRSEGLVISTKVGEQFVDGKSIYDFSRDAVMRSTDASCMKLRTDCLDLVFIHSDGNDLQILNSSEVVSALLELRDQGRVASIGFSGKTPEGARAALDWADAVMVEYHIRDQSHQNVIAEAGSRGVSVIVKKALASGLLNPRDAIRFVLENQHISSAVVSTLNLDHLRANVEIACEMRG